MAYKVIVTGNSSDLPMSIDPIPLRQNGSGKLLASGPEMESCANLDFLGCASTRKL